MKKFLFFVFLIILQTFADPIKICNECREDLYVAAYYVGEQAHRVGSVQKVEKWKSISLERPERIWWCDREILFSTDTGALKEELTDKEKENIFYKNIGSVQGSTVYLANNGKDLAGFNYAEWSFVRPVIKTTSKWTAATTLAVSDYAYGISQGIKNSFPGVVYDQFQNQPASLRFGNELCWGEKAYVEKRKKHVKTALKNMFDGLSFKETKVPIIALIGSGGGYRAMACMIGSMIGAQDIGLLDATTYITSLSGSTWAVGPWLATGLPLHEFKDYMIQRMTKGITSLNPGCSKAIADVILTKYAFGQDVSIVDFYGGLIAHAVLGHFKDERQFVYLPDQVKRLEDGSWPFPIYTAVRADKKAEQNWWEITPFEVGGSWLGWYVPTWAFGRKFNNGVSTDCATQQSMGFYLGTFGSAFAASFGRIYSEVRDNLYLHTTKFVLDQILKKIGDKRLTAATVWNFTAGLDNCELAKYKKLRLVDAGIDFNLPYPPISGQRPERKADILIFLDYSANIAGAEELQKTYAYAKKHNLPFPEIDFTDIDTKAISIFKDENNPDAPVVMYLPLVQDKLVWNELKEQEEWHDYISMLEGFDPETCTKDDYCSTFNFDYQEDESQRLMALTEFNMKASKQKILDAIAWVLEKS